jgi:HAD superfamily hydrolase (TIGR01549 family)
MERPSDPSVTAVVLDAEGTLVDCVAGMLRCWQATLAAFGHHVSRIELQRCSGMDGRDMLTCLLPGATEQLKEQILERQGATYRREYLRLAGPIAGCHEAVRNLKCAGFRLGLATTCKRDELDAYDRLADVIAYCDAVSCGSDVPRGKPHPDLFEHVLRKLEISGRRALSVGDTPYDAIAARRMGMHAVGVVTGGFSRSELLRAGCCAILDDIAHLPSWMAIEGPLVI